MTERVERLRAVAEAAWPMRFAHEAWHEGAPLGAEGLGLDSLEVAELALACESASDRELDEAVLTVGVVTVGRLAHHFWP